MYAAILASSTDQEIDFSVSVPVVWNASHWLMSVGVAVQVVRSSRMGS